MSCVCTASQRHAAHMGLIGAAVRHFRMRSAAIGWLRPLDRAKDSLMQALSCKSSADLNRAMYTKLLSRTADALEALYHTDDSHVAIGTKLVSCLLPHAGTLPLAPTLDRSQLSAPLPHSTLQPLPLSVHHATLLCASLDDGQMNAQPCRPMGCIMSGTEPHLISAMLPIQHPASVPAH